MKKKICTVSFCLALVLYATPISLAGMASGSYSIPNPILSGGGSPSGSASYAMGSTMGQSSPLMDQGDPPLSGSYELYPGWWYAMEGGGALADTDGDGVPDSSDNCPTTPNANQIDTYPPGGNNCGDACECEGNFDNDQDCDGSNASTFKLDFGRSPFSRPCTAVDRCNGDFICDGDVDGTDASQFKLDFGRSGFSNPCPSCPTVPWCNY